MPSRAESPHPRVYRLGTEMVNWYLVEEGGRLTAIDAGLPGFASTLGEDLAAIGFSAADVDAVVLTHADADHTGLVPALREAGARALVHAEDAGMLADPGPKGGDARPARMLAQSWRPGFWRLMVHLGRRGGARPPHVPDAETFRGGETLDVPGRPTVIPTPGHTPGHVAFHFEEVGALFVGDALCTMDPITRRLGPRLMPRGFNVSNSGALAALDAIAALEAAVVLPGHGDPWHGSPAMAVDRVRESATG